MLSVLGSCQSVVSSRFYRRIIAGAVFTRSDTEEAQLISGLLLTNINKVTIIRKPYSLLLYTHGMVT